MSQSPYPYPDQELSRRIARAPSGRAGYKQLIRELGLSGGRERRLLREQLTRMVARGVLRQFDTDTWEVPRSAEEQRGTPVYPKSTHKGPEARPQTGQATLLRGGRERFTSGRLALHRDGFGFVRPDAGSGLSGSRSDQDLFIPPNALHGAMHGDLVLVDEDSPQRDGRRSGRIARVLTRRNPSIVGVFHYGRPRGRRGRPDAISDERQAEPVGNYVQPWDERMGGLIEIPPGAEVPPSGGSSLHRTLGEEAARPGRGSAPGVENGQADKDASRDQRWPLEGLAVEVEITRYAEAGRPATGRVLEVLGDPDAFGVDVEIVIRKHGIPHTFPTHVLAEAEERAQATVDSLAEEELALREDFRDLPIVTIDGETARDFDDAVLVRPLEGGLTELQVHIADVSHYVQAGSALDTEARVRGTSVYFPDRAVPMLPHALSSGMCSLLPREDRLVLSCVMTLDAEGEIVRYRVAEGLIRSVRRMTYTGVQRCLNASPVATVWNAKRAVTPESTVEDQLERDRLTLEQPELADALDRMLDLALRLNRKRVRRGSIDFDLPEPVVAFDPDGNMQAIVRSERGWAHRLIEEFMLSANECVATWLTAQEIPSIYRIHEVPDPKRILEFEETAAAFGHTLGIGAVPVKRLTMKSDRREAQRRSSRGQASRQPQSQDLPERIPVTPQMYQRLIRHLGGTPEERILSYLMLRSLKQARYAEKNEGHFALASPCYTHFTSPIRRYPDLIVHRLLRAMLRRGCAPGGGPLLSTDPQPWKAERGGQQRRVPSQAVDFRATDGVRSAAKAVEEVSARSRRPGRIGWSSDDDGGGLRRLPDVPAAPESPARAVESGPEANTGEPLSAEELTDIAAESSQAERRASDAERELIEWKKMKFMADKIGEHFKGMILSITKFGFFVELNELFVEGLVPLSTLQGDFYSFRDGDRSICGARTGHCFRVGDAVEILLDRIDRQQNRLQFALIPGSEPKLEGGVTSLRRGKSDAKKARAEERKREKVAAKPKARKRKGR